MRGRLLINGLRTALALGLVVALPGCGGNPNRSAGEFVESLVRLLSARFVPSTVVVPRGATRTVDFEVTCDNAALNTTFGRLGIRVRLDPERRLPPGLAATIAGSAPDPRGFSMFPCNGTHTDPALRIAHVSVRVEAAGSVAPATVTLVGYVEVEPLAGELPKDSTSADLGVTVVIGEGTSPTS